MLCDAMRCEGGGEVEKKGGGGGGVVVVGGKGAASDVDGSGDFSAASAPEADPSRGKSQPSYFSPLPLSSYPFCRPLGRAFTLSSVMDDEESCMDMI